jgi:4-hydroxy-tetrahydrodipicolinate reductase
MKIFVNGQTGRLNTVLISEANKQGIPVCTGNVNPRENPRPGFLEADVAIDFSFHAATLPLVQLACELKKPIVIATTGHTPAERKAIASYAQHIPWASMSFFMR